MTKPLWQTLIKSALETEEVEISCQECYELLDEYADLLIAGAAPCQVLTLVKQHLRHCPDCTDLFECLIAIIGIDEEPWPCDPSG
jgi:hypothetical protein